MPQQQQSKQDGVAAAETVTNSAGGQVYAVGDEQQLRRFLILGAEGGTYYVSEEATGLDNAQAMLRLLRQPEGGLCVLRHVKEVSLGGLAAKQNATLLALAACARLGDVGTRRAAYELLPQVCRIPTHLFTFISMVEAMGASGAGGTGWGRLQRRAIVAWYLERPAASLVMLATKYQQREGWAHRDVLRLSHPQTDSPAHRLVIQYLVHGWDSVASTVTQLTTAPTTTADETSDLAAVAATLLAIRQLHTAASPEEAAALIVRYGLEREHVPGALLAAPAVWSALLPNLKPTALLRSLGKLTADGLLTTGSAAARYVAGVFRDRDALRRARLHPFSVLQALATYTDGRGHRGSLSWTPVEEVVKALDAAFHITFTNVVPANKRVLVALDVSGSMSSPMMGSSLSCLQAAAAMALVTIATEPWCRVVAFCDELQPLPELQVPGLSVHDACTALRGRAFGATDCAQPMQWAQKRCLSVDLFVVYTDNETWYGKVHPAEALRQYRQHSGVHDARLAVVALTPTKFSIADPSDPGMLDFVGFDASAPQALAAFGRGEL